jgi:enoyl-CoA hydratase/carnithine racemase
LKLETDLAVSEHYFIEDRDCARVLHLVSSDGTNKLTRACVLDLTLVVRNLACEPKPLIITGNHHFFSAGADLNEIAALTGPTALDFAKVGQALMNAIDHFPALTIAAVRGYCMGGGLDLALACDLRFAHAHCVFGHRGAALGLITGWGGTQRLPRLVGKARAIEMFTTAEKLTAGRALDCGLVDRIAADPVLAALQHISDRGL